MANNERKPASAFTTPNAQRNNQNSVLHEPPKTSMQTKSFMIFV